MRIVFFLLLIAALALAGAWLAERPGDIAVTWMGYRIETSVMVGVAAGILFAAAIMLVWSILRTIWRAPTLFAGGRRERRRRRGERAVSRGLIAVASGDMRAAKKLAGEASRFAGDEPLALLLKAQTAQLAGDKAEADAAFKAMAARPDTRLLGLRGLYVEAQRRGDAEAGRRHAEEAMRAAPALPWAGQAAFDFRCAAGDWAGALSALEANLRSGLVDRTAYRRQRAVLLTAQALALEDHDASAARTAALEATKLAPTLVPAVALAARLSTEAGDRRRAAKLIETAWRTDPHPDLAKVYAYLRPNDSARDRLARIESLVRLKSGDQESVLALARAAIDARQFALARNALAPLTARPTQRVAMLMAELEEAEHGDAGRGREWMGRALRAVGDPRWVADGMVSDRWLPVSPVSGRLDAFEWRPPDIALIAAADAPIEERAAPVAPTLAAPRAEITEAPSAAAPADAPEKAPAASSSNAAPGAALVTATPAAASSPTAKNMTKAPAVIPLMRAPDDPGPDTNRNDEQPRDAAAAGRTSSI